MAILVDQDTRLVVSGITGREGTFHSLRNRDYGTNVVAGVTPGKGGQDVDGIPVFNTFHEAVDRTGANTAMVFVPPRFAADSILEAEEAGIGLIITITEGIPAHDELRVYSHLHTGSSRLVGPNCPGILSPGKANVGIIPAQFFKEGNADYIAENVSKPVLAYIAGFTAPPGKTMGHAGAIVSGSKGTAAAKAEALEEQGVRVGRNPTQVSEIAVEVLGTRV
jgi:succinyl-CoA synthetase alpha subunit